MCLFISLSFYSISFCVRYFSRPFCLFLIGLSHLAGYRSLCIHNVYFLLLQSNSLSWASSLYFSPLCLSILLSTSRVTELLWSLYRHDSCSINNKTEGKRKKKSIWGFTLLWFTGFAKVAVHSDRLQIHIYYQHINIVSVDFLWE